MIQNLLILREQHNNTKKSIKKQLKQERVVKECFDTQTSDHDQQEVFVKITPGRVGNKLGMLQVDPDFKNYRINDIHRQNKFLIFDYQMLNAQSNTIENRSLKSQESSQISQIMEYDSSLKFACECKVSKIVNDELIITHKIVNAKWMYLLGLNSDILEDYVLRNKVLPRSYFQDDQYINTSQNDQPQEIHLINFRGEELKAKMTFKQFFIGREGERIQLEYRSYDVDFKWLSLKKVQQNEKYYVENREKRCHYRLIDQ